MPNIVKYYDATTAITSTPAILFTIDSQTTMLRVKNEDAIDIILTFGGIGSNNDMLIKAGDDFLTAFVAETSVSARSAGSTTGNVFVQTFVG